MQVQDCISYECVILFCHLMLVGIYQSKIVSRLVIGNFHMMYKSDVPLI